MQHYEVCVYTGNNWAAATDAIVYVQLYGNHGDSGKRRLYKSLDNEIMFQKNEVSIVVVF